MNYIKYLIIAIVLTGCAYQNVEKNKTPVVPISPERVSEAISSLAEKSFAFKLNFEKPGIKGSFSGICAIDKVKISGLWDFNGVKENFEGLRIGTEEYKLTQGKWEEAESTPETQPLEILNTVCSFGNYKFRATKNSEFIYEFKPNLLFMDITLLNDSLSTYGEIWINTNSGMVDKVFAKTGSPGSDKVKWNFNITNIGKHFVIPDPLAKTQTIQLSAGDNPEGTAQILKNRFELEGLTEVKYQLKNKKIEFKLQGRQIDPYLIQVGKLEIYKVYYPTSLSEEGIKFIKGDSTNPIRIDERIELLLKGVNYESGIIELTFDKDLPEQARIAVVIDGEVLEVFPEVWGNKLRIAGNRELYIKLKMPLDTEIQYLKP